MSWRDTGITGFAISNVDVGKMQRRAGHDSLETMGYVKVAEDLSGATGTPFPKLPAELVGGERPEGAPDAAAAEEVVGPAQGPGLVQLNWTSNWTGFTVYR
jgi:hypothetical protein